uniref:Uncharacterized protein n=1 Tax=Geoglobus ahangari TaxID=113653 RepID=A0A7C3YNH3_9EURY
MPFSDFSETQSNPLRKIIDLLWDPREYIKTGLKAILERNELLRELFGFLRNAIFSVGYRIPDPLSISLLDLAARGRLVKLCQRLFKGKPKIEEKS